MKIENKTCPVMSHRWHIHNAVNGSPITFDVKCTRHCAAFREKNITETEYNGTELKVKTKTKHQICLMMPRKE